MSDRDKIRGTEITDSSCEESGKDDAQEDQSEEGTTLNFTLLLYVFKNIVLHYYKLKKKAKEARKQMKQMDNNDKGQENNAKEESDEDGSDGEGAEEVKDFDIIEISQFKQQFEAYISRTKAGVQVKETQKRNYNQLSVQEALKRMQQEDSDDEEDSDSDV